MKRILIILILIFLVGCKQQEQTITGAGTEDMITSSSAEVGLKIPIKSVGYGDYVKILSIEKDYVTVTQGERVERIKQGEVFDMNGTKILISKVNLKSDGFAKDNIDINIKQPSEGYDSYNQDS